MNYVINFTVIDLMLFCLGYLGFVVFCWGLFYFICHLIYQNNSLFIYKKETIWNKISIKINPFLLMYLVFDSVCYLIHLSNLKRNNFDLYIKTACLHNDEITG